LLVLSRSAETPKRKCHEKKTSAVEKQLWSLHHGNAPAHASLLVRDFLANMNKTLFPQPPYSPDLALADFLFSKLKSTLNGRRFHMIQEIAENSQMELRAIPKKE
jgi:transposase